MRVSKTIWVILAAVGMALGGPNLAAEEEDVTLVGSFVWERRDGGIPGDLRAVFTPSGENAWDVMFYFDWEDEPRTWKGSATGSLTSGSLEGEGLEDRDRQRTFRFSGTVEAGVFKGEHGAVRDGELEKRGTLELRIPSE